MQPYSMIEFGLEGGIARIALSRPAVLNALSPEMVEEIDAALDEAEQAEARCLLLTGTGRGFCSGADIDLNRVVPGEMDAGLFLETHVNPLIERLSLLPFPTVTAVNGGAVGAGCSLALCGDIVLAARSAYFLQAFINIGLIPDGGATWLLPHSVGRARALKMVLLGEKIPAELASDWGLIAGVVDDAALEAEALALARRFEKGPTVAYGLTRRAIKEGMSGSLGDALAAERACQREAGWTADFGEGVRAFADRRPAIFQGR